MNACKLKAVGFAHKFALQRHWDEVHEKQVELFKCTAASHCRTFRRAFDLERHYQRIHGLNKAVDNKHFVDPGCLRAPKNQSGKVGMPDPSTLSDKADVPPSAVKVEFDNLPGSEVEVKLFKAARQGDQATLKENCPPPNISQLQGACLNKEEQTLKAKLMSDINRADEIIKKWSKFQRDAKRQLKKLEMKEHKMREEALQDQLQTERSERRRMEEKIRRLEGQKDNSVLDNLFSYQELSLGDDLDLN